MMPQRDAIDTLARTIHLLFETCDAAELARRFLRQGAAELAADAGFFLLRRPEAAPLISALRLEPDTIADLAEQLSGWLDFRARDAGTWSGAPGQGAWRSTLAARAREGPGEGLLVLFAEREHAFGASADVRLAEIMTQHATTAVSRADHLEALRRRADQLAVQVEELERVRQALERHSREMERNLAMRGRFFAAMSHELRTPINAIVGFTDLLVQGILGPLTPRQTETAIKITANAGHLLELVDDVLDFGKIEAGRMQVRPEPLDLPALVAEATTALEVQARKKGLGLEVDCPLPVPHLRSDTAKVRQILLNLLSNAVKFTAEGTISIAVRHIPGDPAGLPPPGCSPGEAGWVGIAVRDTGIGIPGEKLPSIFGEFIQIPSPGQETPGTGLGLAISSRLARLLGGELTVDSEVGRSSTFTLFLPCPAPAGELATSEA